MRYAQNATTGRRVVHTVAELQMALADKARGQRISTLRKRKRLTQQAMSERMGIAYRTYQTWEAGTMPEWANLEKLADALGVRVEDIIGDDDVGPVEFSQLDRIEANQRELLERFTRIEAALLGEEDPARRFATGARREAERQNGRHESEREAQDDEDAADEAQ